MVYSYIAIMKYMAMNAGVYDLGVSSQLLYYVFHESVRYSLTHITFNKLIYLPLSVIYLIYPHPQTVLVIQAFVVSLGAYPVYLIANLKLKDRGSAFMIGMTYLLFYPLYGPLWFDFHFMALFPTPFLFSFYFYLKGEKKKTVAFALIASVTDLLAPVIIGMFGLYALIHDRPFTKRIDIKGAGFLIILSSALIFIAANLYIGPQYAVSFANNSVFSSTFAFTHTSRTYEATYFLWIMLPVLFICILAPDLLFLIIPFAALVFANSYFPFVDTMFYQYTALVSAQIFLAFIFGIERFGKKMGKHGITVKRLAAAVLIFNILLAMMFTPLGNSVTNNLDNQHLEYALTGNRGNYETIDEITYHQYDSGVLKMASFVPLYSSIVIQDNMPQLTSGYHWVLPDFIKELNNPQFAITDPYSPAFYNTYFTLNTNHTMLNEINRIFIPDKYGIVAEDYGEILLENGYRGNVRQFIPLEYSAGPCYYKSGIIGATDSNTTIGFNAPFIAPGEYLVEFSGINENVTNVNVSYSYDNFNGTVKMGTVPLPVSTNGNASIILNPAFYMMNLQFFISYGGNSHSNVVMKLLQEKPG